MRPMLTANKNFFAKLAELFVLWIVQIWCLQAYSLVDNTKQRNRTTIYVSYIDMNKWKRNWALSVVVYKIYHSYHVDQSSRLSGVTSFVERSLPPWEIKQKPQETRDEHVARLFEGSAGNNCVCLRWFAVSDSASRFSVRSGDRNMSFFHVQRRWQEWRAIAYVEHSSNAGLEQVQNTVHASASAPASAVNSL